MLTFERANELFRYEPSSGKLFWKRPVSNRTRVGDEAGTVVRKDGYKIIRLRGKQLFVHRIIALLVFGELPEKAQVDHINHTRTDNRPCNLRTVEHSENAKNQSKQINNTSGACGVYLDKQTGRYKAQIGSRGNRCFLGSFKTLEEATAARLEAERKYGYHENHGL